MVSFCFYLIPVIILVFLLSNLLFYVNDVTLLHLLNVLFECVPSYLLYVSVRYWLKHGNQCEV